jgi:hypothetical protein
MKEVIVTYGQTIYDVVLKHYGCFEGIFILLEDNKNLNLTSEVGAGSKLKIRTEVPELNDTNLLVVQFFNDNSITPNSAYTNQVGNGYVNEGYVNEGYVN